MNRVLAFMGVLLVGAAAQAQNTKPGVAVPPNTPGYTYGKSEDAAERRKQAKQQGQVRPSGGDAAKSAEGGAIGTDKSAVAGEERIKSRDAKRPNKRRTTQGGTPDDPLAPAH